MVTSLSRLLWWRSGVYRRQGRADATQLAMWRNDAIHEIEDAVARVQREPAPDPFAEEWRAISSKQLSEGHE